LSLHVLDLMKRYYLHFLYKTDPMYKA